MKEIRKEKIKALVDETLQRFMSEGLTVREARRAASMIENEITNASFDAVFQLSESTDSESVKTDLISSENF